MIREKLTSGKVRRAGRKDRKGIAAFPRRPTFEDFLPTQPEKDAGKAGKNDGHVLISAWDTTTETTDIFLFLGIDDPNHPLFTLAVENIIKIKVKDRAPLYVVRDPLLEPACDKRGAGGHCGIGDLARPPGGDRSVIREICSRLVDAT